MATPTHTRYRCNACGNLTRFEVTSTRRTKAFYHYTVGGDLSIEDTDVLSDDVEEVLCRWCGTGGSVVVVDEDSDAGPDGGQDAGSEPGAN
ncbi:MAG: hypothetical protein WBF71_15020 [Microthrixaceae bacterium]